MSHNEGFPILTGSPNVCSSMKVFAYPDVSPKGLSLSPSRDSAQLSSSGAHSLHLESFIGPRCLLEAISGHDDRESELVYLLLRAEQTLRFAIRCIM